MPVTQVIDRSRCWIVLPTYCEAENLPHLFSRIDASVPGINIVVVDDDSPDGTADVAARLAEGRSDIHIVRRSEKTGLGDAYLAGFRFALDAGAETAITMDSDLSHSPEIIPDMFQALGRASCVVGSRYIAGGTIENWSVYRRLLSWSANRFVRLLFGLTVNDCTSGFRLYRREVLETLVERRAVSQGYSFLVEALTFAAEGPGAVVEVPIRFVDRVAGQSKMGAKEIFGGARSLLVLWFNRRSRPQAEYEECPADVT